MKSTTKPFFGRYKYKLICTIQIYKGSNKSYRYLQYSKLLIHLLNFIISTHYSGTLAEESPQKYSECHQNQSIGIHEPLPFALFGNTR